MAVESATPIVVAVVGEVAHPGLVTLDPGARIADALELAQPLPGVDLTSLNLAQKLQDGQQIVVGGPPAPTDSGGISLNSATAEQLQTLSGVGAVTAQAIIAYREAHGGFSEIAQLQEVQGIGPAKFAQISEQVTL